MQLFAALSEALNNQVRTVTAEKKQMIQEAKHMVKTIRQMEASLEDSKPRRSYRSNDDDDDLTISYPLTACLQDLKEKHAQVNRSHKERFDQVRSMSPHCACPPKIVLRLTVPQSSPRRLNPTHHISNQRS